MVCASLADRAVVLAHRATCGVSPPTGFHHSLALLGGRLRPASLTRACALRLPPGDRLCSPSPPRWAWRPFDTAEPAAPDRPSRLWRCALSLARGRR